MRILNLAEELEKERKKNKELKQELKEANESITWWSNRYKAVEREVEELKKVNKNQADYICDLICEKVELQDRIDKAINYIEENCYDEERKMVINELYNEIPELLNILKGDNK